MQVAGVGVNCKEQHVFGKNAGIWKQIEDFETNA